MMLATGYMYIERGGEGKGERGGKGVMRRGRGRVGERGKEGGERERER